MGCSRIDSSRFRRRFWWKALMAVSVCFSFSRVTKVAGAGTRG